MKGENIMRITIIAAIIISLVFCEDIKQVYNGTDWTTWNKSRKETFVVAFQSALTVAKEQLNKIVMDEQKDDQFFYKPIFIGLYENNLKEYSNLNKPINIAEKISLLDGFYKEHDNELVSLVAAIKITNLRQIGQGSRADRYLNQTHREIFKGK